MIYPLNESIEKLLASAVDEETGEIVMTEEELQKQIEALNIEFDETIKALRNSYMTMMLDVKCINGEATALYQAYQETKRRATAKENAADRTKRFIAWLLQGKDFEKDGVKIGYRKSEETIIEDGFVEWAKMYAPALLKDPEVKKSEVKTALKNGAALEFAHIEEKRNVQVK